jgi:hypothetical protein
VIYRSEKGKYYHVEHDIAERRESTSNVTETQQMRIIGAAIYRSYSILLTIIVSHDFGLRINPRCMRNLTFCSGFVSDNESITRMRKESDVIHGPSGVHTAMRQTAVNFAVKLYFGF